MIKQAFSWIGVAAACITIAWILVYSPEYFPNDEDKQTFFLECDVINPSAEKCIIDTIDRSTITVMNTPDGAIAKRVDTNGGISFRVIRNFNWDTELKLFVNLYDKNNQQSADAAFSWD